MLFRSQTALIVQFHNELGQPNIRKWANPTDDSHKSRFMPCDVVTRCNGKLSALVPWHHACSICCCSVCFDCAGLLGKLHDQPAQNQSHCHRDNQSCPACCETCPSYNLLLCPDICWYSFRASPPSTAVSSAQLQVIIFVSVLPYT